MLKDISIEIVQKCFHQCLHCSSCSTQHSAAMLPLPAVTRLIAGLHDLNVDKICLSGGEPLLHPDIVKIVQEITAQQMRADIYSCGIVGKDGDLTAIPGEMLLSLKKAGLKTMIFNLPSIREATYDLITQSKNRLPLVLESISRTVAHGISAEIHFVPMRPNIADAIHIVEFAQKASVQQVNFLKLMPHGRALQNIEQLLPGDDEIHALQGQLFSLKKSETAIRIGLPLMEQNSAPPCHAVNEKLYIKYDGCVLGCEAFKYLAFRDEQNAEVPPDNILKRDIRDIYQSSAYLRQSLQFISDYGGKRYSCENCPVQKYIREQELLQ